MKKNKKRGFTLIELIIVIAILGILAGILIPSMMGYVGESQSAVCTSNRRTVERMYLADEAMRITRGDAKLTLQEFIDADYDGTITDTGSSACPAGGTYYADGDTVKCTYHDDGQPGGGGGSGTSVVPGTTIPLSGRGWPTDDMVPAYGEYAFSAGETFEYNGAYYVVTKDWNLPKNYVAGGPDAVLGWDCFEKLTGTQWNSSSPTAGGQIVSVKAGDIYNADDGSVYVFTPNQGGYGHVPPQNYPTEWYKVK